MTAQPAHILVVDDNPATRYSTRRVLEHYGYHVTEADCGRDGLAQTRQGVDLVILDVHMPDLDGLEVCRLIRADEATRSIPVVHVSATRIRSLDMVEGLDAGADAYLVHPVDPAVLVATVRAFLRARQAEDAMRRSDARFRAIFDQASTGIALISPDLRFVEVNPQLCSLLGRQREDVAGRALSDFVAAAQVPALAVLAAKMSKSGSCRSLIPLLDLSGATVFTDWAINEEPGQGLSVAVITDITQRKAMAAERERLFTSERAAREAAETANRAKDDFLATLSHELRNPLTAIVGWTEVLVRGKRSPEDLQAGLSAISRNAKIQTQLIYDLLDVSRIISGQLSVDLEPVDLQSIISAVVDGALPQAAAKQLQLEFKIDGMVPLIKGDPGRLQQVAQNVIGNAIKFTPAEGRVNICLRAIDGFAELVVSDTGIGISPEFLPHIFERFRQADQTSTRSHGGLGLGLAIVGHLVELHHGSIVADSNGLDRGTEFRIRLPLAHAGAQTSVSIAATAPSFSHTRLAGSRILLVEDDPDARAVLHRVLTDAGAQVWLASDAGDALAAVQGFAPDLLVSDIGMPRMDGYEFIRRLRLQFSAAQLPGLALTAFARPEDRDQVIAAGFQHCLTKPIEPKDLIAALEVLRDR